MSRKKKIISSKPLNNDKLNSSKSESASVIVDPDEYDESKDNLTEEKNFSINKENDVTNPSIISDENKSGDTNSDDTNSDKTNSDDTNKDNTNESDSNNDASNNDISNKADEKSDGDLKKNELLETEDSEQSKADLSVSDEETETNSEIKTESKTKSKIKNKKRNKLIQKEDLVENTASSPTVIINRDEIEDAIENNIEDGMVDDIGESTYGYEEVDFTNDYVGQSDEYEEVYDDEYEDDLEDEDVTKYDEHGFAKFAGEVASDAHTAVKKYVAYILIAIILIFIVIVGTKFLSKKNNTGIEVSSNSSNDISSVNASENNIINSDEELKLNEYPEINELVNSFFESTKTCDFDTLSVLFNSELDSIEKAKYTAKAEYVEDYTDIEVYSKTGPYENSYLIYVKYMVKIKNWDPVAPSLQSLLVCSKDDGSYYLFNGELDENIAEYIKTASSSQDVVDLISKVEAEYKEVLDTNVEFKDYMNALNESIKNDVGEMIASEKSAEASVNDADNSDASSNDISNNDVSGNDASSNSVSESYEVKTTTTVNVRVSDSENADKLGKAEQGLVLTCMGEKPNGWSKVIFEGQTAYIKTEFLIKLEGNGDNSANTQDSTNVEEKGTVRVKETVNIRSNPNTDSNLLGVAYMGETFPMVEILSDGWTKIKYNGQIAYVKTEFLESN